MSPYELGSSNCRFKTLYFHESTDVPPADKTQGLKLGNGRNGIGKTSFVRILRYLLDGRLDDSLKSAELAHLSFWGDLGTENAVGDLTKNVADIKRIERAVKPQMKMRVDGVPTSIDAWKLDVSQLFQLPADANHPMVGQPVSQLVRDYFGDPLKAFAVESAWESGARIGYLLGFTSEILAKAGEASALEKNRKALKRAITEGALGSASMNEPELRARLAKLYQRRLHLESKLSEFRVGEQYVEYQAETDCLTQMIRNPSDEGLVLKQRKRDPELTTQEEESTAPSADMIKQLETMYVEIGIVLPDVAARRFEEVADFHSSVVHNCRLYLESERVNVLDRFEAIKAERRALDCRRADVMNPLNDLVALETFRSAERELAEVDSIIVDLERGLEPIQSVNDAGLRPRLITAGARADARTEAAEREGFIEEAIPLFQQPSGEIYDDRGISLLIDADRGILRVAPEINDDVSSGTRGVRTFLLDIVCLAMAIKAGRAPRILVHNSLLFDSTDDRQVVSCLNIGARLVDDAGFQYTVALNSDRLQVAEAEGFDRRDYVIDPVLMDVDEDDGLFGSRLK